MLVMWGVIQGHRCALELQEAAHLNGAAEGNLAIALTEVHVSHGQLGSLHKHCTAGWSQEKTITIL